MTRKQFRLSLIALAGGVLAVAAGLVLYALSDRIALFQTPGDILAEQPAPGTLIRLGGLVEEGSRASTGGTKVTFRVEDGVHAVPVIYDGILPDLFREGQGIVTEGRFNEEGTFIADTVLAKHDETYMPKEVADALKEQGVWQGEGDAASDEADAPLTH